ncbi:MAG: SDR family oxidoreductase [Nitrospinota bacterium]|nr:SDR family oxidoreductase [Nitrospinota bacterium]
MPDDRIALITGTRKGIGRHLAQRYAEKGLQVIGCSRRNPEFKNANYHHFCLDVTDEKAVKQMFFDIKKTFGTLHILVNNAGIASMNFALFSPLETVRKIYDTNLVAAFLFCREAALLMKKNRFGRIINLTTVAVPFKLEGESAYASSKAALISLTEILAREFAEFGVTVNAVGPTPIKTDLIRNVPEGKIQTLIDRQAIRRFGEFSDVTNVVDFYIQPESDFVTGQTLFLGGA